MVDVFPQAGRVGDNLKAKRVTAARFRFLIDDEAVHNALSTPSRPDRQVIEEFHIDAPAINGEIRSEEA